MLCVYDLAVDMIEVYIIFILKKENLGWWNVERENEGESAWNEINDDDDGY